MCHRHAKKLEAYCQKERVLLCIDCIIENNSHQTHGLMAIETAFIKESELAGQDQSTLQSVKQAIKDCLGNLDGMK